MKRNRRRKTQNKTVLIMICLLLVCIISCATAIIGVISFTGNEKKLHAPQTPTPYIAKTPAPTEEPEMTQSPENSEKPEESETPKESKKPEKKSKSPVFTKAFSSSVREPHNGDKVYITYVAKNVLDGNVKTTWTPDSEDKEPWIKLTGQTTQTVSGLEIENGYSKTEKLYNENMRAKDITVSCGGEEFEFTLDDAGCGVIQNIDFPYQMEVKEIKITINSFYSGTKYNELCISGIKAY